MQEEPPLITLRSAPTRNDKADTQPYLLTCQDQLPAEMPLWVEMGHQAQATQTADTAALRHPAAWGSVVLSSTSSPTDDSVLRPSCHKPLERSTG